MFIPILSNIWFALHPKQLTEKIQFNLNKYLIIIQWLQWEIQNKNFTNEMKINFFSLFCIQWLLVFFSEKSKANAMYLLYLETKPQSINFFVKNFVSNWINQLLYFPATCTTQKVFKYIFINSKNSFNEISKNICSKKV